MLKYTNLTNLEISLIKDLNIRNCEKECLILLKNEELKTIKGCSKDFINLTTDEKLTVKELNKTNVSNNIIFIDLNDYPELETIDFSDLMFTSVFLICSKKSKLTKLVALNLTCYNLELSKLKHLELFMYEGGLHNLYKLKHLKFLGIEFTNFFVFVFELDNFKDLVTLTLQNEEFHIFSTKPNKLEHVECVSLSGYHLNYFLVSITVKLEEFITQSQQGP